MLKPRAVLIAVVVPVVAPGLTACGNDPTPVPDVKSTPSPTAMVPFSQPPGDVTFSYPANWALIRRTQPGVATVASGGAAVTVWGYRIVSVVTDAPTAKKALARLLASLKRRDPNFKVSKTQVKTVFEAPAVEIDGTTEIAGNKVRVRSIHMYRGLGEYVFDAYADPAIFERVNREVFQPMLVSLRFFGRPAGAAAPAPAPAPGAAGATPPATPQG